MVMLLFVAPLQADEYPELSKKDKLVAAYLFNFTKFIEWPDLSERDPRSEIVICLQANSEILGFIKELVASRRVGIKQLPVVVKVYQHQVRCDMVYVQRADFFESTADSEDGNQSGGLAHKNLQEVLIIASNTDLYPDSAAISFYEQKKRLRFEVNMNKINSLKLKVRSELLKLARIKQ